jgi:ribosomal RNA-processing protein 9
VWSLDELAYVETLFGRFLYMMSLLLIVANATTGHQDQVLDIDALAQERCISVGARDKTARLVSFQFILCPLV